MSLPERGGITAGAACAREAMLGSGGGNLWCTVAVGEPRFGALAGVETRDRASLRSGPEDLAPEFAFPARGGGISAEADACDAAGDAATSGSALAAAAESDFCS